MIATTRLWLAIVSAIGVGAAALLATHAGLGSIYAALDDVGWLGLAWVCMLQFGALMLCAAAWKLVADDATFLSCLTARCIRDGVSHLAGIIPVAGEVAGARALSVLGASAGVAAASTVVDVAIEALAQAIYTVIGLMPLLFLVGRDELTHWIIVIAVAIIPIFAAFLVTRYRGALEAAERIVIRIAGVMGFAQPGSDLNVANRVFDLYQRRRRIWLATLLHVAAWGMGAVQVWAAGQAMDRPLSPGEALAIESLVYAARGMFFFVPWAAGVQEGAFVLVGAVLGIDAAGAIALSLVLRARDILIGVPSILAWYTAEGWQRWLNRVPVVQRRKGWEQD
jgi:putative membrane protein